MTDRQSIKPSQFIYTYGPGAILDSKEGPRMILGVTQGLFTRGSPLTQRVASQFMITDDRMSKSLLDGANIFRLPYDDEQKLFGGQLYLTNPFPVWKLCTNRERHRQGTDGHGRTPGRAVYILYLGQNCPFNCAGGSNQQAIRFVQACSEGHLDEIEWTYAIHRRSNPHNHEPDYYFYDPRDGNVSSIRVDCSEPGCPSFFNMGDPQFGYYSNSRPCTGREPQLEGPGTQPRRPRNCNEHMRMTQRRAANLRVSETKTLLKLETALSQLYNNLNDRAVSGRLTPSVRPNSMDDLRIMLDELINQGLIDTVRRDEILHNDWDDIDEAITAVTSSSNQTLSYNTLIVDEFKKLIDGSNNGIPPQRDRARGETICEMIPAAREVFGVGNQTFRVSPVSRLTTVTVQTGFRREVSASNATNIPQPARLVEHLDVFPDDQDRDTRWFPGIEYMGEGIFIRLENDDGWHPDLGGQSFDSWSDAFSNRDNSYSEYLFRDKDSRVETHPVFVWWHTLSHLLIRAIGEDAGYSSAAIRERVYLELDGNRPRGGILLYTTQPGAEGSMGGLIALVPYFDRMLRIALDQLDACSGDPLCFENKFLHPNVNGATCYGCTMNSETSCEHRNMWLDRHVLMENRP